MMVLIDRALVLNPSFARGWYLSSNLRRWAGQLDIAIEHIETSLRLNPRARNGLSFFQIGANYFYRRRFDEAVSKLLVAINEDPSYPEPYRYLAACYAHMGRLGEARAIVGRLRAITPLVVPSTVHTRNLEYRELFLSGLRLAAREGT